MGATRACQSEPKDGQHAEVNSQDDAPLCFRLFEGYYSSGRPGAMSLRVRAKNIMEGLCASRVRLRITQCERST